MRLTHVSLIATIVGAGFWGLSGTAAQALFQNFGFPVLGLLAVRMIVAGPLLLIIKRPKRPTSPMMVPLVTISIFGFIGSQITYLAAIEYSNAATATLLQFLFLPMVAGYEALTGVLRWSIRWTTTIILTALGTVLLIAGVSGSTLQILVTPLGLIFGILAAVTAAYYSISSRKLVRTHGPWWLTCWGFVIGGLVSLPFGAYSFLSYSAASTLTLQFEVVGLVMFVAVFGTMLAYSLYLFGLQRLSATEVGVAASIEPISATTAAYLFLGVILTPFQYLGGALILAAVAVLATKMPQVERSDAVSHLSKETK